MHCARRAGTGLVLAILSCLPVPAVAAANAAVVAPTGVDPSRIEIAAGR
jgi:hypothetical protein